MLRNATLPSGETADVTLHEGRIVALAEPERGQAGRTARWQYDLAGYLLLPTAAEPHAHLDKALLAERYPNPAGDLRRAVEAARLAYGSMDEADIRDRAARAVATALRHGYTAIRTHVNCERGIGTRAVRALCALRDEYADLIDLQVVAMLLPPIVGSAGAEHRALLTEAIALGANAVGGAPQFDERPGESVRLLVRMAAEAGLQIDLHLDETTDARMFTLELYAAEVERHGLSGRATASHCVSLGQQARAKAERAVAALARAGIGVVTLPQTNLWLQGRGEVTRVRRGLTAISLLLKAGVVVAGGGDNWRDPFNPLGRIDPLETAALLVAAAHLSPEAAYAAVSARARRVLGLPPIAVEEGSRADLLAIRARSIGEAVASADPDRWVFRAGRLIARTRVTFDVDPDAAFRHSNFSNQDREY